MPTQREIWDNWTAPETLEGCVRLFFELLDKKEYSSNDVEFHPNRFNIEDRVINSCRVWDTHRLGKVMTKMKELSQYNCRALGEYNTPKTGTCDCEEIQGNYVCKYNNI